MYPRRFESSEMELSFLEEFQKSGVRFARIAALSGAFVAISFFFLMFWFEGRDNNQFLRQGIRLFLFLILFGVGVFLAKAKIRPGLEYNLVVGITSAIACMVVAILGFLPTDVGLPRSGRLAVAMTLTCFLVYAFTRLPIIVSTTVCLVSSFVAIMAGRNNGDDFTAAIAVYLVAVNITGYVLACNIERRERELFRKNLVLADANQKAARDALSLSRASAAKSALLAAVNHDLRQPMASVALYLEQLRGDLGSPARIGACVRGIQDCVGAIEDTVARLSTLELLGGDAHQGSTDCDLRPLLRRLESVYSQKAKNLGVRFEVRVRWRETILVRTVSARLWDILSNIVSNAIKFSADGHSPTVLVVVRRNGVSTRITVIDNGPGVPDSLQDRIFDEYFQVSPNLLGGEDGVGLGLYIVKGLVDKLPGHSLRLRSKLGFGARFDLVVPSSIQEVGGNVPNYSLVDFVGLGNLEMRVNCSADRAAMAGFYILLVSDGSDSCRDVAGFLDFAGALIEISDGVENALRVVECSERVFDLIVIFSRDFSAGDFCSFGESVLRREGLSIPILRFCDGKGLADERVEVWKGGACFSVEMREQNFEDVVRAVVSGRQGESEDIVLLKPFNNDSIQRAPNSTQPQSDSTIQRAR